MDPTLGKQFEGGVKANFFNERLGVTLAAFELRKENQPSFILTELADESGLSYDPSEVSIDGHILYISKARFWMTSFLKRVTNWKMHPTIVSDYGQTIPLLINLKDCL